VWEKSSVHWLAEPLDQYWVRVCVSASAAMTVGLSDTHAAKWARLLVDDSSSETVSPHLWGHSMEWTSDEALVKGWWST
jgi:hypothetical protein